MFHILFVEILRRLFFVGRVIMFKHSGREQIGIYKEKNWKKNFQNANMRGRKRNTLGATTVNYRASKQPCDIAEYMSVWVTLAGSK